MPDVLKPSTQALRSSRRWTLLSATAVVAAIGLGFFARSYFVGRQSDLPVTTACQLYFAKRNLCASIRWMSARPPRAYPSSLEPERFLLTFWRPGDDNTQALTEPPGEVLVSLWMPGMGHGSEKPTLMPKETPGQYVVDHVIFSMKGDWEIWVSLIGKNGLIEKAKVDLHLE
jgi:hypothetical protein